MTHSRNFTDLEYTCYLEFLIPDQRANHSYYSWRSFFLSGVKQEKNAQISLM